MHPEAGRPTHLDCHILLRSAGQMSLKSLHAISCRCRWVEHDPQEIWSSVLQCMKKGLSTARQKHADLEVVALGITNQRETTMAWDRRSGAPVDNLRHVNVLIARLPIALLRGLKNRRQDQLWAHACECVQVSPCTML